MHIKLKNIWWLLLLRGIIYILFGFVAILWPTITFIALALVFALYIILSGIFNLIYGILGIHAVFRYWFLFIILGLFEIGVGAYALNNPTINIAALILLIGFAFIVRGVFETITAFEDMHGTSHKALLAISGVLGIIAGIIVLRYPVAGSLAFTWVLGVYALITGSIQIGLAMTVKDITDDVTKLFSDSKVKSSAHR